MKTIIRYKFEEVVEDRDIIEGLKWILNNTQGMDSAEEYRQAMKRMISGSDFSGKDIINSSHFIKQAIAYQKKNCKAIQHSSALLESREQLISAWQAIMTKVLKLR